ncbi:MAG: MaoC family dehydratase N-terminal domain-containing protein, partial [Rhodospirillales bacterium]
IRENAANPDFDGIVGATVQGLPPLPLEGFALLNAGTDVEFYRYAEHGDRITAKNRYDGIVEKESRSGPMLLVFIETEYRNDKGELLMKVKKTHIRRPPKAA